MNEAAIKKRLDELDETMDMTRPKGTPEDASPSPITKTAHSLEESLDHLRMQVKYLLFDIEATRRENGYLRRMLETRNRQEPGEDEGNPPKWQ